MSATSKKQAIKILLASLLAVSLDANSAQVLIGKPDDNTLSAVVSRSEPTMIRIDGHRVRRVFGAEGDFTVTPDKDAGTAYIKPTSDKQAFSVFVSDETGRTWKVLLSVVDGPSDSIIIKSKAGSTTKPQGRDMARNQAIKRVLLALESDETDMESRATNELVPLWKEAMFVLIKVVEGALRGEKYMLTNVSDKPMVIDERELYRKGVVAVSVERPELGPAETTAVYVISEVSDGS